MGAKIPLMVRPEYDLTSLKRKLRKSAANQRITLLELEQLIANNYNAIDDSASLDETSFNVTSRSSTELYDRWNRPHTVSECQQMTLELKVNSNDITVARYICPEVFTGRYRGFLDVVVQKLSSSSREACCVSDELFLEASKTLRSLKHDRLVPVLCVCLTPRYIVTEFLSDLTLQDALTQDCGRSLTFDRLIHVAAQIADGMSYLESRHFVHEDLRAGNVLVNNAESTDISVKITRFGVKRLQTKEATWCVEWTAPEIFTTGQLSVKSDVWAFGVLLYELVTFGQIPYQGMRKNTIMLQVLDGYRLPDPVNQRSPPWSSCSGVTRACWCYYYTVMLDCWKAVPDCRPTFEFLRHAFADFHICAENLYASIYSIR